MAAVAATVGWPYVWKRRSESTILGVDAITEGGSVFRGINKNSCNGARGDVDNVVDRASSLGKSGKIACEEAESFLILDRSGWNTGIQAK